jgi:hypothetical protein
MSPSPHEGELRSIVYAGDLKLKRIFDVQHEVHSICQSIQNSPSGDGGLK